MKCSGCQKRVRILSPSGLCEDCLIKCQRLIEHEFYIKTLYKLTYENQGSDSVRPNLQHSLPPLPGKPVPTALLGKETIESKKWKKLLKQILSRG